MERGWKVASKRNRATEPAGGCVELGAAQGHWARLLAHGFSPRVCVEHPFEDGNDEWHNRCFWSLFTRGSSEAEPTVVERRRATPERKGETMMEFERRAYGLTKDALAKD